MVVNAGIYTSQVGGVNTGPSNTWSTDPEVYYAGGSYTVGQGDHTMGIAFYSAGLSAGDIVTYNYAYIFGPNAFGAATTATTAYDPSATFTVTDVGSATSAASGAPTVTGTSTATITVSDTTTVNTALPVITGAVAHHVATEGSGVQTIARETTTTTTTPMRRDLVTKVRTTTTYSDSTTTTSDSAPTTTTTLSNSVSTAVANDSFSGRVDQMSELGNINSALNRGMNMNAFRGDGVRGENVTMYINGAGSRTSAANGYRANSDIYGIGIETEVNRDWRVGAQYNRAHTRLDGTDSNTKQNKDHVGLFSVYDYNDFKVVSNLGYAMNSINSNRRIDGIDFSNSHSTKGTDTWLNNRVYSPDLEGFRPFVGYTVGRNKINKYAEAGSIQSARTVAGVTNNYNYGEAGVRYSRPVGDFVVAGEVSTTTDQFNTADLRVGYRVNKDSQIAVSGTRQTFQDQATNTVTVMGIVRF